MKTVLVVEDSRAEQRLIVLLLQQSGLKVALADSAESAIVWLTENSQPDLIVLDIVMPGISGLDFCRQIRTDAQLKDIPIVFFVLQKIKNLIGFGLCVREEMTILLSLLLLTT